MTIAPVGIRCPEHAGGTKKRARVRLQYAGSYVTRALIILNVAVWLLELFQHAGIFNTQSGWIYEHFVLVRSAMYSNGQLAGVAHGEWWRLITSAFLHFSLIHLAFNLVVLGLVGAPVEEALGHMRYLVLYLVSGLAGSAGALLLTPNAVTAGASGAIFGILGAMLILEWETTGSLRGPALTLIIVNLAFTFYARGSVSMGGHLGGLAAGILGTLALTRASRLRRPELGYLALVAIGIASVAVAYWQVRGVA
jgi:membrane associated rhomboid family serine protease